MTSRRLTTEQQLQENQYGFPYHYLDLGSEEFKYIWNVESLAKLRLVKEILQERNISTVLDAGCGDGRFAYELTDTKIQYTGIDFSDSAIRFARAFNPDRKFLVSDLTQIRLSQKFKAIVLIETLEHIPPNKITLVLNNLHKSLADNGILIVTVPSKMLSLQDKHYQHFSPKSLQNTLGSHFADVQIKGFSKTGFPRLILSVLRSFCLFMYPFRTRIPVLRKILTLYSTYFSHHLVNANTENALSLVAICRKEK